jgi:hypothetical protein
MPGLPLTNPRWEKFCRAYVRGPTAGNAAASYAAAGFAGGGTGTAKTGAYKLLQVAAVRTRIGELQAEIMLAEDSAFAKAADKHRLSREAILGQLGRMGFASIHDYVGRDETGAIVVDLARIDRDTAAGIVELTVTERGEGPDRIRQMRIRLCDRVAPLVHLGKHFGLFIDRKGRSHGYGDSHGDQLAELTDDELEQYAAELDRQFQERSPAPVDRVPAGAVPSPEPPEA